MSRRWLPLIALLAACGSSSDRARENRAPDLRTLTSSREYSGEKSMNVAVEFAAGRLNITPGAAGTLYRSVLRYDQRQFQPQVEYTPGNLRVGMQSDHVRVEHGGHGNRLDLQLGPQAPLDLDLKFAAGESNIELGGLQITHAQLATGAAKGRIVFSRPTVGPCQALELQVGAAKMEVAGLGNLSPETLNVQGGVGDLSLDFSGAWRSDVDANVHMGLGSLRLDVPRGIGVRVRKSSMLAAFEAPDMVKQGDLWTSAGYDNAQRHLNIQIDAAFGTIRLNWLAANAAPPAADTGGSF